LKHTNHALNEPLWDFAIRLYSQEFVAEICLKAQDRDGLNVPLLLFALWADARGMDLSEAQLKTYLAIMNAYDGDLIRPLRAIRRDLKITSSAMAPIQRQEFRQTIKSLELNAEKALLEALEAQSKGADLKKSRPQGVILNAIIKAMDPNLPDDTITSLCDDLFASLNGV